MFLSIICYYSQLVSIVAFLMAVYYAIFMGSVREDEKVMNNSGERRNLEEIK